MGNGASGVVARPGPKKLWDEVISRKVMRPDISGEAWAREKEMSLTIWHKDELQVEHNIDNTQLQRPIRKKRFWEQEWDEGWDWEPEWDSGYTDIGRGVMVNLNGKMRGIHTMSRREIGHVSWSDPHVQKALEKRVKLIAESMRPGDIERVLESMKASQIRQSPLLWNLAERILENYGNFTLKQLCSAICLYAQMGAKHHGLFNVVALALSDDFDAALYVQALEAFRVINYSLPLMNGLVDRLLDHVELEENAELKDPCQAAVLLRACQHLKKLHVDIAHLLPHTGRAPLKDKIEAVNDIGLLPYVREQARDGLDWRTLRVIDGKALIASSSSSSSSLPSSSSSSSSSPSVLTFSSSSILTLATHVPEVEPFITHPRQQWPTEVLPRLLCVLQTKEHKKYWIDKITDEGMKKWRIQEHFDVARRLGKDVADKCGPFWARDIFRFNAEQLASIGAVGGLVLMRAVQKQIPRTLRAQGQANRKQDNVTAEVMTAHCGLCAGASETVWSTLASEACRIVLREGIDENIVNMLEAFSGHPGFEKVRACVQKEWLAQTKVDSMEPEEDEYLPPPLPEAAKSKLLGLL